MAEEEKGQEQPTEEMPELPRNLPKPELLHLVETFGTQALIYLGKVMNPITQKYEKNLELAKYQVGILEILQEKTKGNLDANEESILETTLHTARMAYVDVSKEEKEKENLKKVAQKASSEKKEDTSKE